MYEQVSSVEQMEGVLHAMQEVAKECGEASIGKLVAGGDLDTGSEGSELQVGILVDKSLNKW